MTITTEEAEAKCQELLDHCHGQPAKVSWPHRVLHDAVATIRTLAAERDKLSKALAGALANLADASRAQGEAEGKLAASEMAGVVEGWKERAERAEAEAEKLRGLLWYGWKEMNAIRAMSGVPLDFHGTPQGICADYWSQAVDAMEKALGDDAKPWPSVSARAALEGGDNANQQTG